MSVNVPIGTVTVFNGSLCVASFNIFWTILTAAWTMGSRVKQQYDVGRSVYFIAGISAGILKKICMAFEIRVRDMSKFH